MKPGDGQQVTDTRPIEPFTQPVVDVRAVTNDEGLEHRFLVCDHFAAGIIDHLGEVTAGVVDQPARRKPDTHPVSPQLFHRNPGAAVNALVGHVPAIIETARILKITEGPEPGRKDQPVARRQCRFPP